MTDGIGPERAGLRTVAANLRFLREKKDALRFLTDAQLEEAVRSGEDELSSSPTPEEAAELFSSVGGEDFVSFCSAVSRVYGGRSGKIQPDSERDFQEAGAGEPVRIAYLQNAFSDRAYRVFSSKLSGSGQVAAVYFPGFREVAEEVYSGRCSHAILPTASSEDGQIVSFRRLIGRFDLKITAATDVSMDDERTMRFVLLRRRLPSPPWAASFMDISAVPTDELSAGDLLSACERFGAVLISANSHPSGPEEDRNVLDLTFDLRSADSFALYLFLEGSHARYETVGSYELL